MQTIESSQAQSIGQKVHRVVGPFGQISLHDFKDNPAAEQNQEDDYHLPMLLFTQNQIEKKGRNKIPDDMQVKAGPDVERFP